jgi:predicted AlkP superfamily pyrophosphatase or phosphodiesterase
MRKSFLVLLMYFPIGGTFFAQNNPKPKLVVGIVVDQMSVEYLHRFKAKFGENGFMKLMNQGTHCENAQYNYVPTFTGPGHASIYTGTTPSNHGIVANDWFDRNSKSSQNCVGDSNVKSVGTISDEGKCSPSLLKSNTITDQLKMAYPNSKVISVSIKDRGAILPGGHLSDGSFWFDYASGNFISSSFFMSELPTWVQDFNNLKFPEKSMKQTWNTLLTLDKYTESTPDNSIYEVLLNTKITPEFPYNFKEINKGKTNFDNFTITPFANTYLADFALSALKNEKLGKGNETDFLAISFSTPDIAGHAFGPYSVELEDIYLRLDLEIEKLLNELEKSIGKDNFVLFLTADHAVVPVPQYLIDHKLSGGYFYIQEVEKELNRLIESKYGLVLIDEITNDNIYLNRKLIQEKNIDNKELNLFVKNYLLNQKGVKAIYTLEEITQNGQGDEWISMVQKGFDYQRAGDLIFLLEPGYLPKSTDTESSHRGTSHGSAFNYDTQVPLLWFGAGIKTESIYRKVNIVDIAATLAPILRVQRPNAATGEPIIELFK